MRCLGSGRALPRFSLVVLVALVLGAFSTIAFQHASAAPPLPHTVLVDTSDATVVAELHKSGATLLIDYGAFSLWRVSDIQRNGLLGRSSVTVRDDFTTIALRGTKIDTRTPAPIVPLGLAQSRVDGEQFWMVQFVGPLLDSWLDELRAMELTPVIYMPQNAYLVWGDAASIEKLELLVAKQDVIQWTGAYHPAYRLAPALQETMKQRDQDDRVDVTVQLYNSKELAESLSQLRKLSGVIFQQPSQVLSFTNVSLQLPVKELATIAHWPDVYNIEPWVAPEMLDEVQGQIIAGNLTTSGGNVVPTGPGFLAWLASKGFPTTPSSYPIIDIVDDGIDTGNATNVLHPDFHELGVLSNPDRVEYIANCTTDTSGNGVGGHGNLNAGIVGSYNNLSGSPHVDANGYRIGLGISPYGRIAGTKVFRNTGTFDSSACGGNDRGVVAAVYNNGGAITSNSWGAAVGGAYNAAAQAYDALTRDASTTTTGNQEMLHIFAAGNAGPGVNTIGSPGTAKNVLTVGATENVRGEGVNDGCNTAASNNADDLIGFSSRGPTDDERIKPDIMAPGVHIQGPASQDPAYDGTGVCGGSPNPPNKYYPPGQTLYTWSSGTSHSTPAVAGAASLVYEYYGRVLNPGHTPSAAMLKALLLHTPRYLTGVDANDTLPSAKQGWGDVNLGQLFDNTQRYLLDQSAVLDATGKSHNVTGTILDPSKPFRVSLVWTDAPGNTTGNAYVNDLDLEVTIDGEVYKGNVFNGAFSITGGSFDPRNNAENVFLHAGSSGSFAVRVIARNIAGDGVPGNSDTTDQDFALIISNGQIRQQTVLVVNDISWDDVGGSNDGIIDPGETGKIDITLGNSGTLTATNVSGLVQVTSGNATMINATSPYSDIVPSAVVSNRDPYTFTVDPAHPCGQSLTFKQTVTYNISQTLTTTFTIPVGVLPTNSYSYTGPPRPIPDNTPAGVTATIRISSPETVSDVDVRFGALHTYDGDLDIFLISPRGTIVELSTDNGTSGDNYTDTIFDDEAATSIVNGRAPFTGRFKPESPLSALDGELLNGVWTIRVVDDATLDTGTLLAFGLDIQGSTYACPIRGLTASNNSPTELGDTTTFSATLAPAGTPATYTWNFGDGTTGSGATTTHTYTATGTYTATVTASTARGTATATTIVTIRDKPIRGLRASNNSPTQLGRTTTLSATVEAGTNVVYTWDFGDGTTGSGATTTHTYTATGTYTATVTAKNSRGSATASTVVEIFDEPITGLSIDNDSPSDLGNATVMSATVRTGSNVTFLWNFGDGSTGRGARVEHAYASPGTYRVIVTAVNSRGSTTASMFVFVQDQLIRGLVATNNGPTIPGSATTLSAAVETGTNILYTWDFGDGSTGVGKVKTHVYGAPGVYTATVTASNSRGIATATTRVEVRDVAITGLKATNNSPTLRGTPTTLRATVRTGTNVTYVWDFGDGTTGNGATVNHTYRRAGTYTAKVTALNSAGQVTATTVVKIVNRLPGGSGAGVE